MTDEAWIVLAQVGLLALLGAMGALAAAAAIRALSRGPERDRLDDRRVLLTFRDAWDLSPSEMGEISGLGEGRLHAAIFRLESGGFLDGYWQGGSGAPPLRRRRITLTHAGGRRVTDLARSEIEDRDGEGC